MHSVVSVMIFFLLKDFPSIRRYGWFVSSELVYIAILAVIRLSQQVAQRGGRRQYTAAYNLCFPGTRYVDA